MNTRSLLITSAIAGVTMALLSNLPGIAIGNVFANMWFWGSGIFAVWLYRRIEDSGRSPTPGQGAVIGALAGLVGGVLGTILSAFFSSDIFGTLLTTLGLASPAEASSAEFFFEEDPDLFGIPGAFIALSFLTTIFDLALYPLFGAIGGFIGGAILGKSTTSTKPETLQDDNAITDSSKANVPGFQASVMIRRIVAAWLVLSQLLAILSLNIWAYFAALATLPIFDLFSYGIPSDISMDTLLLFLFLVPVFLYPLFPLACAIVAWLLYRWGKNLGMVAAVAITSLPVIVPLLVLAWIFLF